MSSHGPTTSRVGWAGVAVCVLICACGDQSGEGLGQSENDLRHGGPSVCTPVDSIDSLPDRIDEDCDGRVDEDADYDQGDCPALSHVIVGTRGNDVIHGTKGRDCILGFGGNDTLYGEAGDDVIFGGPGDDHIFTGAGYDVVRAGAGNDTVDSTGAIASVVYGEAGQDTLIGGSGFDQLFGGADNDMINGGGGTDIMNGGDCHDMIVGGKFADLADGAGGFDACTAELKVHCEKTGATAVSCSSDSNCGATERCAAFTHFCVPKSADTCGAGGVTPPACVPTAATDTTCNGVDDDCDGNIDDDFAPAATSCGVGACAASGMTSCMNGTVSNSCVAGTPGASDSTCDGIDNNCNGQIDENYAPTTVSCGLGPCTRTGVTACSAGTVTNNCVAGTPAAPSDTACNGVDDDCDGAIDDDFTAQTTSCGSGVCATTGVTSCDAGVMNNSCAASCEGACNDGQDDDHDGKIDCADSDCSADPACHVTAKIGDACKTNADCADIGPEAQCETLLPGGYCFLPCTAGCPSGTFCWLGSSCVIPCNASNSCDRPDLECGGLGPAVPDPFCHPTCAASCPTGTTCDPTTSLCE